MNLRTWAGVETWQMVLREMGKDNRACALKLPAPAYVPLVTHLQMNLRCLFFWLEEHRSIANFPMIFHCDRRPFYKKHVHSFHTDVLCLLSCCMSLFLLTRLVL
jgi:hypothetical protein